MPNLEFEMIYRLSVRGPTPSTKGSPRGERIHWEMSEATLDRARIKARTEMPGGDWYAACPDGYGWPDVWLQCDDFEILPAAERQQRIVVPRPRG